MIPALVASPALFCEIIQPQAKAVRIEAAVRMPDLDQRELAAARLLADSLLHDTVSYAGHQLRSFTIGEGQPLRAFLMPDHIRLQIGVPTQDLKLGISILAEVLSRSRFGSERIKSRLESLPYRNQSYMAAALNPAVPAWGQVRPGDVEALYQRIFRPSNVSVAIAGAFAPGTAERLWRERMNDWIPGGSSGSSRLQNEAPSLLAQNRSPVSTLSLDGPEFSGGDAALPVRLLAVISLGTGKGSSVFRVLRQKRAWSYRQEALLWPTPGGFKPRVIVAFPRADAREMDPGRIRAELEEDIASWSERDLARAIAMAEGILALRLPLNPIHVGGGAGLIDPVFMAAYWPLKTGRAWRPDELLDSMRRVRLADLKQMAAGMVSGARSHLVEGR